MPDLEQLYPGRFLKGRELDGPTHIKIVSVSVVGLETEDKGRTEDKAVLTVKMRNQEGKLIEKEIVWCKTNAILSGELLGRDYVGWQGRMLTIAFDPTVRFGKETPGGIRVVGSPDLKDTVTVSIKRPRKKQPEVYALKPFPLPAKKE